MSRLLAQVARLHPHQWDDGRLTIAYEGTPTLVRSCTDPSCSARWIVVQKRAA